VNVSQTFTGLEYLRETLNAKNTLFFGKTLDKQACVSMRPTMTNCPHNDSSSLCCRSEAGRAFRARECRAAGRAEIAVTVEGPPPHRTLCFCNQRHPQAKEGHAYRPRQSIPISER